MGALDLSENRGALGGDLAEQVLPRLLVPNCLGLRRGVAVLLASALLLEGVLVALFTENEKKDFDRDTSERLRFGGSLLPKKRLRPPVLEKRADPFLENRLRSSYHFTSIELTLSRKSAGFGRPFESSSRLLHGLRHRVRCPEWPEARNPAGALAAMLVNEQTD